MVVYDEPPSSHEGDFGVFNKSNDLIAGESDKHTNRALQLGLWL